jgi:hypothetical protein
VAAPGPGLQAAGAEGYGYDSAMFAAFWRGLRQFFRLLYDEPPGC